jgi:pyruvate dehydrogenase E1 component alpha subunit
MASKTFSLAVPFKTHKSATFPILNSLANMTSATATKDELLKYHRDMFTLRRVEVTCDQEYKARKIRGFCHLYDGQEAIAVGTEAALTRQDDWITTYRCHGAALVRGCTPTQIFAEQFGSSAGCSRGKGGSMHMYRKESNFYGGAAIVGAHVPVGAGLAFFHKYRKTSPDQLTNVSIVMYGDGAANQGQAWEAANMAQLWKLPVIFLIENNQYGMGTSIERSSALTEYYKQGGEVIPGVQVNGMDVLSMRECIKAVKAHCAGGNGPCFVEAKTYRYHGHSMSDPGITYRSREEVEKTRAQRDPIELVKMRIVEAGFATADELKDTERAIRASVQEALNEAAASPHPPSKELITDIITDGTPITPGDGRYRLKSEFPPSIRMPDRTMSLIG